MEAIEAVPGRGVVRACAREGFTRHRLNCDLTTGLLAGLPSLGLLAAASVKTLGVLMASSQPVALALFLGVLTANVRRARLMRG